MKRFSYVAFGAVLAASAFSQYTTNDLTTYANDNLQNYTDGFMYPLGGTTLNYGAVPELLGTLGGDATTTGVIRDFNNDTVPHQLADITINQTGVTTLYTLINSAFGSAGTVIGDVTAKGLLGETYTYSLIEGVNVRDHFNGFFVNTLSDPTVQSMYFGDGSVRLDMQTITLPSVFATDTLTDVVLNGYAQGGFGQPFMAGLTTSTQAVPEPTTIAALGLGVMSLLRRRRSR